MVGLFIICLIIEQELSSAIGKSTLLGVINWKASSYLIGIRRGGRKVKLTEPGEQ